MSSNQTNAAQNSSPQSTIHTVCCDRRGSYRSAREELLPARTSRNQTSGQYAIKSWLMLQKLTIDRLSTDYKPTYSVFVIALYIFFRLILITLMIIRTTCVCSLVLLQTTTFDKIETCHSVPVCEILSKSDHRKQAFHNSIVPHLKNLSSPLLKKPTLDKDELSNYRPISNLSLLAKIIERVFKARVSDHLTSNNLLNPHQSAYYKHHSALKLLCYIYTITLLML